MIDCIYLEFLLGPNFIKRYQKLCHNLLFPVGQLNSRGLEISSFEFNLKAKIYRLRTKNILTGCLETFGIDESYDYAFYKILSFLSCYWFLFWSCLNLWPTGF